MKPAYFLAYKLGIPVILQPEWNECQKLWDVGQKLWDESQKLLDEGQKLWDEGWRLREEGEKFRREGVSCYTKVITRELGSEYVDRIDWKTGEVRC